MVKLTSQVMAEESVISTLDTKAISDIETPFTNGTTAYPSPPGSEESAQVKEPAFAQVKESAFAHPTLQLVDRCIDQVRSLKVAVIGGGLAGITAGILLPAKVPGIDLTIFEKNDELGGTWLENIYPGVRCDIPSHVYQSTFAPNTQWSDKFATGKEICDYWQETARKYNVYQYVKLNHSIDELRWVEEEAVWRLQARNTKTQTTTEEKFDIVLTAIGRFNSWKLPQYPGISEYQGVLRHASHWDPDFNLQGKTVAVIGNGASGIQLVSNLQKQVNRLDHYARNKTWVSASWAGDERTFEHQLYSEAEKANLQDPEVYLKFRKEMENKYWRRFGTFFKGSKENAQARERWIEILKQRISKKPWLLDSLVPDFSPNCRRPTPGPGYLEAITEDNVDYIQTPIKRFTAEGIETTDGIHRKVDAVFCATGANVDGSPPFPIFANGVNLSSAWKADGEFGFPYTYFGLATPGFSNLFFVHGPHGTGPSGTVPHSVEVQLTYFAKVLRKISREGIRTISASPAAADDFIEYSDSFFERTVLSEKCSSWYNSGRPGGKIHGVWPGSAAHVTTVRREPRWEDWQYSYLDSRNRFAWYFGNGWTKKEQDDKVDMTSYLKLGNSNDLRNLHESWWDLP